MLIQFQTRTATEYSLFHLEVYLTREWMPLPRLAAAWGVVYPLAQMPRLGQWALGFPETFRERREVADHWSNWRRWDG